MEGRPEQGYILPCLGVKLHETPGKEEMKVLEMVERFDEGCRKHGQETRSGVVGK
jgi:hypothetical protein